MAYPLLSFVPPPPDVAVRLTSDDPDEVTSWVSRQDGYHSRVVHGTGPYGFQLARIGSPALQVAWCSTRLASTLRATFRNPTFHLPLIGHQQYTCGRRRMTAAPGEVTFAAAGAEASRYSGACSVMAVELDSDVLASELSGRRGARSTELQPVTRTIGLPRSRQADLIHGLAALARAYSDDATGGTSAHAEGRLLDTLTDILGAADGDSPQRVAPGRLHRLEEWIDAHLADVITLGRLCAVAQVSERSLQIAFQARRGMSPMRFVAERRLTAVQKQLALARPHDNVTAIATRLGFTHLGRFSHAYRAAFGESPSQTLARSLRTRSLVPRAIEVAPA